MLRGVEASLFIQELRGTIQRIVRDELAQLDGAHRAYAWGIGDPAAASLPPPAPFIIELRCRPVDFMAVCLTAPSGAATFDVQRSIDAGSSFVSMLQTLTTIASGQRFGAGAQFKWEMPETRALVAPTTEGALPMVLQPGDVIKLVVTAHSGAKSLALQLRVQRVGEYGRAGQ